MTSHALTTLPVADAWNMHGTGAWWTAPMMIGMALFWGALILGVAWLVRDGVVRRQHPAKEPALTILDRQFAEGTIARDDYEQRRDVLTGAADPLHDWDLSSTESEGAGR